LDSVIRDLAVAAIDNGGDLSVWAIENPRLLDKRKRVLAKVREQLTGPQPARRLLKRPTRLSCGLTAGDVLALDLSGGPALLRVVRVNAYRVGEDPILEELDFNGTTLPAVAVLEQLPAKINAPISMLCLDARFFALGHSGWKEAGFRKVGTILERPGDSAAPVPSVGIRWSSLASRYQRRAESVGDSTAGT
jgi:hypothetical protein